MIFRRFRSFLCLIVLLGLAGCAELVVKQVNYAQPIPMPEDAHPAPIKFSKMRILLPPGTEIGLEAGMGPALLGGFCSWQNYPVNRRVLSRKFESHYIKQAFADAMEANGYDVVDSIEIDFRPEDEIARAEYFVSARVMDVDLDLCERGRITAFNIFNSAPGAKGKIWARIDWSVYDALKRTVVYKTSTEGYSRRDYPNTEGLELLFMDAFEMASHNLAADHDFYRLIVEGKKPPRDRNGRSPSQRKFDDRPTKFDPREAVDITALPLSRQPLPKHISDAQNATVMIQKSDHGSGFFITREGHILTNQHVVGDAKRMRVVTHKKKHKLVAEVLRRDKVRDVALLKLEAIPSGLEIKPLPIRTDKLTISEDIYAVGVPKHYSILHETVTKGIVSAQRLYKYEGARLPFIQGDVEIHGGNSGGPLLDEYGNIAGISVIGLFAGENKNGIGLNLFVPITEALRALDITLDDKTPPPFDIDADEEPTPLE